ncbi:MAG: hypothetical protein M1151_06815 [Candidatus Thermoplasmatota archaeon]|nr:hypothetical protein [Candidatus Thermoplasmatota archaeon]
MNCISCGAELPEGAQLCPVCSTKIPGTLSQKLAVGIDQAVGKDGAAGPLVSAAKFQAAASFIPLVIISIIWIGFFSFAIFEGLPVWMGAPFIGLIVLFWAFGYYRWKRLSRLDLSNPQQYYKQEFDRKYGSKTKKVSPGINAMEGDKFQLLSGESIVGFASPVYRMQNTGSIGPVGIEKYTENAIIITDRRLVFLTVPMPGQGVIINGGSMDMYNDAVKRRTIRELSSKSVDLLKSGSNVDRFPNDYYIDRSDIQESAYLKVVGPVRFASAGAVRFRTTGGMKVRYSIIDEGDLEMIVSNTNAVKKRVM